MEDTNEGRFSPALLGVIYAVQGNNNVALELLEHSARMRDPGLAYMNVMPFLEHVWEHPRFRKVMSSMNL